MKIFFIENNNCLVKGLGQAIIKDWGKPELGASINL